MDAKQVRLTELEQRMVEPGFWNQADRAREVVEEVRRLKRWIGRASCRERV